MLQLHPPRFLPLPRRRLAGRRRRARPALALNSKWKLPDVDTGAVRERVRSWMSVARGAIADAAHAARERASHKEDPEAGKKKQRKEVAVEEQALVTVPEVTVEPRVAQGWLSLDAIVSIEQFARLNGLTGRQVQRIFEALAPKHLHNDAQSLVEYSCFRYLSRDNSDFHPNLKELAFQKLVFVTMLAWEDPYKEDDSPLSSLDNYSVLGRLVGEDAFVRIAPAVAGVADVSTAHHLFRALVGAEKGLSFDLWTTYLAELLKVHHGRQTHQMGDNFLSDEQVLCIGSSKKRPVLKWEENTAWPGNLTLTDKALYFEAIGLSGTKKPMRLDLTDQDSRVEKAKVGPFGSKLFDSAVTVSSGSTSDEWTLEFVDFSGEMRRDVWLAFISEIISVYGFIREYGPGDDPANHHVYGAHKGKKRAVSSAAHSIARLQSLQFIRRLYEDPAKLVQFSYLSNAPFGDVVLQTLAVKFWGGPLVTKAKSANHRSPQWHRSSEDPSSGHAHVYDIDGSVYLRKWMTSPSWASSHSANFWRNSSVKHGVILSKSLVVGDKNLVEKAMVNCKEKSKVVERTQATIVAATIEGIPSNIDLFKELMLPFAIMAENFKKLQRWENPRSTICCLLLVHTVIFRNMLSYVFPFTLMMMALSMLAMKGLKEQGRLGRSFGKVTIRDQPPSNTIQKILALKEAMASVENYLQNLNVSLLKIRTIFLAGQPEVTTQVALVLLASSAVLLVFPFKYVLAFFTFDLFTRELEFRREMVRAFMNFLKERWESIHAAPVVVLPYEGAESSPKTLPAKASGQSEPQTVQRGGSYVTSKNGISSS
ncbi:hypothetical protein PAHAL_5G076500 [Panicum hallii]|uniref:DUF639 domain-containing protein n=1 Tax=Panicum hallii TaxID=206008 RepID=A0A2S3HPM0_9POAL|nr:uncharacterized protein LOC112893924 [Panicum hallii]PAN27374.1 hypothetical protein PAHAL_5G076500 [Panicum hallii]